LIAVDVDVLGLHQGRGGEVDIEVVARNQGIHAIGGSQGALVQQGGQADAWGSADKVQQRGACTGGHHPLTKIILKKNEIANGGGGQLG
jgi:hypothetical protein